MSLPGNYTKSKHRTIYAKLMPIIRECGGTKSKCATDAMLSDSEHCFMSAEAAKKCVRSLNRELKKIDVGSDVFKAVAKVMPVYYETNGDRTIVRPDYSFDPGFKAKTCRLP